MKRSYGSFQLLSTLVSRPSFSALTRHPTKSSFQSHCSTFFSNLSNLSTTGSNIFFGGKLALMGMKCVRNIPIERLYHKTTPSPLLMPIPLMRDLGKITNIHFIRIYSTSANNTDNGID